jgi:ABC-2 type transport system ATP-binding protein
LSEDVADRVVRDVRDITVNFGRQVALDGVTVQVRAGVTALVGVNGAGKTTLMRVIAGLLRPGSGSVTAGVDSDHAGSRVVLMPQSFTPPPSLRVREFFELLAWLRRLGGSSAEKLIDRTMEDVGLADKSNERLSALSGGMLRRAMFGQALISQAELLLLDEPTAGLDPEQRVRMRELIDRAGRDVAVLVSSHLMEDVGSVADRVIMLDSGRLTFDGPTGELRRLGESLLGSGSELSPLEAAFLALRSGTP